MNSSSIHRPIRSYVKRSGRITPSQKSALEKLFPIYAITYDVDQGLLPEDFLCFQNESFVIDIGFGDGESLIELAKKNSASKFLGIEVYDAGIGHCLSLIKENNIENLKLVRGDAVQVISGGIKKESIDEINILFPDPWPKKRHHKRRLINNHFIDLISKSLKIGGLVNISTDWEDYAEHIKEKYQSSSAFKNKLSKIRSKATKFEKRGLSLGHKIFDFTYERIA